MCKVAIGCYQAGANQHQVIVVRGNALENPQESGMYLRAQIIRRKFRRPYALDVPQMKILVTAKPEKLSIVLTDTGLAAPGQVAPAAGKTG